MTCPWCEVEVRDHERLCVACGKDLGSPNIRAANQIEEKTALAARFHDAMSIAGLRSYPGVLARFKEALRFSKAVICRSISQVKELMSNDNVLYASFYQLVGAGARRPDKSVTDRERLLADPLLFPHYHHEIRFAALSLDGTGVSEYGSCSMVLKTQMISERATVFEENSLEFCRAHKLGPGNPLPPGYRAVWEERDLLGCAKLGARFQTTTTDDSFPNILKSGSDFIEVHIFGSLHRASFERIVVGRPLKGVDKLLFSEIIEIVKSDKLDIIVEEKP
jgi:hypothetical protein